MGKYSCPIFFKLFTRCSTKKFDFKTVVCCAIFVVFYLSFNRLTFRCENEELNKIKHNLLSMEIDHEEIAVVNQVPLAISIKLTPANTCQSFGNNDTTIFIAIKSYVGNYEQRLAIRKTWGNIIDPRIKRVFFVGRTDYDSELLEAEYNNYLDIVQGSFWDRYQNNIIKSLMIFKWVKQYCPKTKYVLLVDDDYFVNMKNILMFVDKNLKFTTNPWWMYGYMCRLCAPKRFPSSKWYVPFSEYKYLLYPTYVYGGSIFTTSEVIKKMIMVAPYVKHIHIDDVFVGMLAKVLGIDSYHQERFYAYRVKDIELGQALTSHGFGGQGKLLNAWNECNCSANSK